MGIIFKKNKKTKTKKNKKSRLFGPNSSLLRFLKKNKIKMKKKKKIDINR